MKRLITILLGVLITSISALSQNAATEPAFGVKFSGFVRSDIFFDTRQTVSAREGAYLLWPERPRKDINGDDINEVSNLNMLAILTRLTASITGPDAFGAKTTGLIEADFFGQANDNISLFRLRHAYVKVSWPTTNLMIGQYWNPLFVTDSYPGTVSVNTGTPYNSFARNPQIRLTQNAGSFSFIAAALAQRDFTSYASANALAPATATSTYLRNSSIPDFHLQIHFNHKSESGPSFFFGSGIAYKTIVPRLSATVAPAPSFVKVNESISGLTAIVFAKITTEDFTIKLHYRYGENLTDVLTPGGYGITGTGGPEGVERSYSPIMINSYWFDVQSNGAKFQAGFFTGFLKNNGTKDRLSGTTNTLFGNSMDFDHMMRFSPRVVLIRNKLRFSLEAELSYANWGDGTYDLHGLPQNNETVSNKRFIFTSVYSF